MGDETKILISPDSAAQTENDARLNLLYEIGRILASEETMNAAAPQILEAICRNLSFELGEIWRLSKEDRVLRLENVWHLPSPQLEKFVAESRRFEFAPGEGLPGKIWAKSEPLWLENIGSENNMPRRFFAEEMNLQSGFAFPVLLGEKFLGAVSFFSLESRRPDQALMQMFVAIGNHIGQFIKRERTESHLHESEDRYRAFIEQSTEGIWRFELNEKFSVDLPVDEQVELAFRYGYLAECNDAMARMYGLEKAKDLVGSRIADLLDMNDEANAKFIRAFIESGYNLTDAESHEKDVDGNDKFFLNSLVGVIENENLVRVWGTQRDITTQKRAEKALLESEESYRIVAETASDAIIKIDTDSRVLFVNHSVERVFGYRAEEMLGQSLTMIMPEDLRERHRAGFRRYLETGKRHLAWAGIEIPARHADGHIFPLEISFGEYNEGGKRFFIGIARDITERKQSEQALRESEEHLQLALDISRISTFDIDLVTDAVKADSIGRAIYGWSADEPLTFSRVQSHFHPEDRDEVLRRVEAAFEPEGTHEFETEQRIIRTDGEVRWIRVRGRAFFEGEATERRPVRCLGTYIDITSGKHAEEELLERERLALLNSDVSRALIQDDSLPNILAVCTEAIIKHLDAAFARIWTFNQEENVLELKASSGIYTHLDGQHSRIPIGKFKIGTIAEERKPHLTNSVIGDERVGDQEWAMRERMIAFAGYPLVVEDRLVGVVAMFARQPLTGKIIEALAAVANAVALGIERKQTERERERLLMSEKQAREIAEEANRAKDEFIALVSHELRSPLNAMLGWTRILQNQKPDEQTTNYAFDVIVRNARSQSKLIEDLLDIARVGEKKLRLEMQPTELAPIINTAVEIIKPTAEAKNISIHQSLDRTANFITGDDDRLRQVMDNLLSNAVKFTPAGGKIDIRLERGNKEAKIIVSDTGQGFSRKFLPQMFERFKQADPSTTRRHGGLGIGLSLARDLVELHGGTISAQSAGEGEGATFTVSLPLRVVAPIKENSSKRETMDAQGKLSGFWILAVDDEADARELVSFMLQINGAKVTTANSAVEALDILKNSNGRLPDILLSDISMPNESGYALLEKIRALPQEHGGQIPAVALTAFNRPEDREAAYEAGFQKHLGKPVEPEDLISAIIETAGAK